MNAWRSRVPVCSRAASGGRSQRPPPALRQRIPEALVFGEQRDARRRLRGRREMPDWPRGAGAAAADQIPSLAQAAG